MKTIETPVGPESIWNKNFICIATANIFLFMGHFSVNPLVATYAGYLGTTPEMAGFLAGMFFIVSLAFHPVAGPAMTKLDKRKLLILVFLLGTVANTGYALFHSVPAFIVFRVFSGVQYSFVAPLLMALAGDHLPKSRLAYGIGIHGLGGAIGSAVGPAIGEAILNFGIGLRGESLGFTLMFLFGAASFAIAMIPSFLIAPDVKSKEDIASTGAWYKNMFSKHTLPAGFLMLLTMTSYSLINTYVFEFAKEQNISGVGIFYLVHAAMLGISRPLSGYLTLRAGIAKIMFPALALLACAMLVIGFSGSLWLALLGAVLTAIGYGAAQPSIQTMSLQSETALKRGVATNTYFTGLDLGFFLGPFLGGFVYARTSYATVFKSGAIPAVLAMTLFAAVLPIYKRRLNELDKT